MADQWYSKRWSHQLVGLNAHEGDGVVQVGRVKVGRGDEFRIAKASDGTEVCLGLRDEGTALALKKGAIGDEVLKKERELLRDPKLDDPSIVRYVDYEEDKNFGYLQLTLCEKNLEEYIKDKNKNKLSGGRLLEIGKQVLTSVKVLHRQKPAIIHQDLKPQSFLIDFQDKVRLAGIGSEGTKCWKATEHHKPTIPIHNKAVPYSKCSDIQVAGMLLYYIITEGKHPFGDPCGGDEAEVRCAENIRDGKYNLSRHLDAVAKDLIKRMINTDPKKRPTVEECLAHPYFWGKEKRVDYLQRVGNLEEIHQDYMSALNTYAILYDKKRLFIKWKKTMKFKLLFASKTFQDMEEYKGKPGYSETVSELLLFIRNLHQHYAKDAAKIDLMEMFPGLFGCVYLFAQEVIAVAKTPCKTLMVDNVASSVTERVLRQSFKKKVSNRIIYNRSKGYAFVVFKSKDDAMEAMKRVNNTDIEGQTVRIEYSQPEWKPRTLFVKNLPFTATSDKLKDDLKEIFDDAVDIRLPLGQNRLKRGIAIEFLSVEQAEKYLKKADGAKVQGCSIRVDFERQKRQQTKGASSRAGGRGGGGGFGVEPPCKKTKFNN